MLIHPQYLSPEDLEYECRVFHVNLEFPRSQRIAMVRERWEMEEERHTQRELIPVEGTTYGGELTIIRRRIGELLRMLRDENPIRPAEVLTRLYNTTYSLYRWEDFVRDFQCDSFSVLEVGLSNALHLYMSRVRNLEQTFNRIKRRILRGHRRRAVKINWEDFYRRHGGN
jgi:hypothetical protein